MAEADQRKSDEVALVRACRQIFGDLSESLMSALLDGFEIVDVPGGEALFRQGDPGDSLYIVLRGRLNISVYDAEAGDERVVGESTPGGSIGEMGLLTGEARTASIWASRDSRLARIGKDDFDALSEEHPALLRGLARVVVDLLKRRTSSVRYSPQVSTIAILPTRSGNGAEAFSRSLADALRSIGATLAVDARAAAAFVGAQDPRAIAPGSREDLAIREWVQDEEDRSRFLVLFADAEPTDWTLRCLRQADIVLVVGRAGDDPTATQAEGMRSERPDSPTRTRRLLVLLHPEDRAEIRGTAAWLDARQVDHHHHVRSGVRGDLERLARIVSGTAIGLVLGGGGARGFAHAGVYRALHEQGIPIDWVGGTSIGAVFGAGIAMGWDPRRVEDQARASFVKEKPFGDITVPLVSLIRGRRIDRMTRRTFSTQIEDMPLPYFCVSSNLTSATLSIHERGELSRAIRASVSLPGVLPPTVERRNLTIDGGILNNLPVDVMRERSVGSVIAVDLAAGSDHEIEISEIPGPLQLLMSRLPFMSTINAPGIVTVLMKATVMASAMHSRAVREQADLLLNPPVGQFGLLATNDFEEIVRVGYENAREALEGWQPQARSASS